VCSESTLDPAEVPFPDKLNKHNNEFNNITPYISARHRNKPADEDIYHNYSQKKETVLMVQTVIT
jgi:hypothetical protein